MYVCGCHNGRIECHIWASPAPVKTSQKKDGRRAAPQVLRVIGPPPQTNSGSATEIYIYWMAI